jgi:hypothetical protein
MHITYSAADLAWSAYCKMQNMQNIDMSLLLCHLFWMLMHHDSDKCNATICTTGICKIMPVIT